MKVLHLPTNIASQMRVTVLALREMGIEARGLSGLSRMQYQNAGGLEVLPRGAPGTSWLKRKGYALRRAAMIVKAIAWADVVHWHYAPALPLDVDLRMAAMRGSKRFVEFWGSDIRDPETEMADNPWYARVWDSGEYEYKHGESRAHSIDTQRRFAKRGVKLLIPSPGMAPYVKPEFFPQYQWTAPRLFLNEYEPHLPSAAAARPLVVHAPTAPGGKGTKYLLAAMEKLRTEIDFDFQLIHGMPHHEARELISRCDLFVDQLIIGEYGLASVEAMALGKPVICYLKPSVLSSFPEHVPVINASPDTVEEVLREWLRNGARRRETGERSRAWVEERHDARRVVQRIAEYYQAA
jgi:hypothetical protein